MRIALRPPRFSGLPLERREVGHALLVHPRGEVDGRAVLFAQGLARDPEATLVVADLPSGALDTGWEPLARALADLPGSLRIVFGRGAPEETRDAAQRIAERLRRTVLAPDGAALPTAGGGLFVPGDRGSGWLKFRPGRDPQRDSQRFPKPRWEFSIPDRPWQNGPDGLVEPTPSGVWVRGASREPAPEHRRHLVETLPCDPDVISVVLGSPGGPTVSVDDVVRFWSTVLPTARHMVRFIPYGPVETLDGVALGQRLADRLDHQVAVCAGMPVVVGPEDGEPEVRGLREDGTLGWRTFVEGLLYVPAFGGAPTPPVPIGARLPLAGVPEISAGVYRYAPDAVLEVVQGGLWMRPPADPLDGDDVRRAPAVLGRPFLVFDRGTPGIAERMRALAVDLLARLGPDVRSFFRLAPADELTRAEAGRRHEAAPAAGHEPLPVAGFPAGTVAGCAAGATAELPTATTTGFPTEATAGEPSAPVRRLSAQPSAPAAASAPTAPPSAYASASASGPFPGPEGAGAPHPAPQEGEAVEPGAVAPASAPGSDAGAAESVREPLSTGVPTFPTAQQVPAAPTPPAAAGTPPPLGAAPRVRLESGLPDAPVPPVAAAVASAPQPSRPAPVPEAPAAEGPATGMPTTGGPVPGAAATGIPSPAERTPAPQAAVRVQPVPRAAARALPPQRGIAKERDWVRRTFSEQYNALAGSVSRVMSESPGLRGESGADAADALTDLVAVRLYLSGDHRGVDAAVQGATAGPHVPLARCVTAGLRRLPSYRGPSLLRADLGEAGRAWYHEGRTLTEWAFCTARTAPHVGPPDGVDFLIWSLTARRTDLLEPSVPDRVLFLPGTGFKVLKVHSGARHTLLLRELTPAEGTEDDGGRTPRVPLDQIALNSLEETMKAVEQADARWQERGAPDAVVGAPPGLITGPGVPGPGAAAGRGRSAEGAAP
ncbi:hypothetical protein LO771_17330 [Streptacidiphilus sp. ASG 303]|uniref:hypothetical protein n=1 Tax=Streptacidiphilus sp. ASG 303 TaxID=2896847 RepID=UPI001E5CC6D6|nr:hypothetical protein [Streptacidiphilus sp. ASG 303]MCD0484107.1 hypothetical protein [Streptacidiphilus sp. ASG 303]